MRIDWTLICGLVLTGPPLEPESVAELQAEPRAGGAEELDDPRLRERPGARRDRVEQARAEPEEAGARLSPGVELEPLVVDEVLFVLVHDRAHLAVHLGNAAADRQIRPEPRGAERIRAEPERRAALGVDGDEGEPV